MVYAHLFPTQSFLKSSLRTGRFHQPLSPHMTVSCRVFPQDPRPAPHIEMVSAGLEGGSGAYSLEKRRSALPNSILRIHHSRFFPSSIWRRVAYVYRYFQSQFMHLDPPNFITPYCSCPIQGRHPTATSSLTCSC